MKHRSMDPAAKHTRHYICRTISCKDRDMVIMTEGRVAGELDKSEAQEIRIMELATKTFRNTERQPAV